MFIGLIFAAISLYLSYFIIRAAVEAGIRRALPDDRLRPKQD